MEYKSPNDGARTIPLDFLQDWSDWLGAGDTISVSAWSVETGLTVDSESNTSTSATVIISGGTAGKVYKVENDITTANGLQASRVWFLTVQQQTV